MRGDVAAITNGVQWAVSNSGFGGGTRGAWPADPKPGLDCPYGSLGTDLALRCTDGRETVVRLNSIKVDRLQRISEEDAQAEGTEPSSLDYLHPLAGYLVETGCFEPCYRDGFAQEWAAQHGLSDTEQAWQSNPWVWCIGWQALKGDNAQ